MQHENDENDALHTVINLCEESRFDEVRKIIDEEQRRENNDGVFVMACEAFLFAADKENHNIEESLRIIDDLEAKIYEANRLRVVALYLNGNYAEAARHIDDTTEYAPFLAIYFDTFILLERYDDAMKTLLKLKDRMPEETYNDCMRRCKCAGKTSTVKEDVREKGYASTDPLLNRGEICMANGDYKNAVKHIKKYFQRTTDPVEKENLVPMLAVCLVGCGRAREALDILKRCTIDLPVVHRQRAIAYQMLDNFNAARDSWKKAGNGLMEGRCLFMLGRRREALDILKKLERNGQVTPLLYELMSQIYELDGNKPMSRKYGKAGMALRAELVKEMDGQ